MKLKLIFWIILSNNFPVLYKSLFKLFLIKTMNYTKKQLALNFKKTYYSSKLFKINFIYGQDNQIS